MHRQRQRGERSTGFAPASATGGSAFVGTEIVQLDRPERTATKVIVSGGRALGSSDKFNEVLTPLVDKLGAALAGTL